ncbi:D-arabinono-1,4-lactone oxidase [Oerskovia flava]|uniref:D-arabinono-1,4-lactone oxidase n=1 Tax=Oerskovia flava TaxID=2986422 RepID=UPI002240213F|nr:D-arabinono-1,4-lactone oxidase [Oerskovia sp. JB1-3-2]
MTTTHPHSPRPTNWARNLTYSSASLARPATLEELQDLVAASPRVRALGSRHSFNDVADTPGVHVQVDLLDDGRPAVEIGPTSDPTAAGTTHVSVNAGLRYGEVSRHLQDHGLALGNLASLPHISVAGAVATATHGSGDGNQSLASAVVGLEIVTGDGELVTLSRGDADFPGAVVNLGALGVVTRLVLEASSTFDVRQDVDEALPWDDAVEHFDALTASAYSVSMFTDWGPDGVAMLWRKSRLAPGTEGSAPAVAPGARRAEVPHHPVPGIDPVHCTAQLGRPGPWNERLAHFRLDFTPSNGDELQSEYLVPRRNALAAIEALRALGPRITPLLQVGEIRTVAADDLWLSPFDEDTVGFHLTWFQRPDDVARVLPAIEDALGPLGARPHWGKVFTVAPATLRELYPRFGDFRALADRLDPTGRFRGGYVAELLG